MTADSTVTWVMRTSMLLWRREIEREYDSGGARGPQAACVLRKFYIWRIVLRTDAFDHLLSITHLSIAVHAAEGRQLTAKRRLP